MKPDRGVHIRWGAAVPPTQRGQGCRSFAGATGKAGRVRAALLPSPCPAAGLLELIYSPSRKAILCQAKEISSARKIAEKSRERLIFKTRLPLLQCFPIIRSEAIDDISPLLDLVNVLSARGCRLQSPASLLTSAAVQLRYVGAEMRRITFRLRGTHFSVKL